MKHVDGRPWNEKAPIILPDTTLKARFLNDTLTDEDYSHILTLIDKDTAMKPKEETRAIVLGIDGAKCPSCNRLAFEPNLCHHCGQRVDWRTKE